MEREALHPAHCHFADEAGSAPPYAQLAVIKELAAQIKITGEEVDGILAVYQAEMALKKTRLALTYPKGAPF